MYFHACHRSTSWDLLTLEYHHLDLTNLFLKQSSQHVQESIRQVSFVTTYDFCLDKLLLSVFPRVYFRFFPESVSPRFKSFKTPNKLLICFTALDIYWWTVSFYKESKMTYRIMCDTITYFLYTCVQKEESEKIKHNNRPRPGKKLEYRYIGYSFSDWISRQSKQKEKVISDKNCIVQSRKHRVNKDVHSFHITNGLLMM